MVQPTSYYSIGSSVSYGTCIEKYFTKRRTVCQHFLMHHYLLLHVVQDVFEVEIVIVVFNSFSYSALKQGRRLDDTEGETQRRRGHGYK